MDSKPKILLYGAYDRYNYGDNLMPILFHDFMENYSKDIFTGFDVEFVSISDSDLSEYDSEKTKSIIKFLDSDLVSYVVVVGGETMAAHLNGLFLNTFKNELNFKIALYTQKIMRRYFIYISNNLYPSPWEFPYIPNKKDFKGNVKIILNTVGGVPSESNMEVVKEIDYISVRDERSFKAVSHLPQARLVPDSVLLLSYLYSLETLASRVNMDKLNNFDFNQKYIVVQVSPHVADCSPKDLAKVLLEIKKSQGVEPILLPIGYASLHDDYIYLKKVQEYSGNELQLFYKLTVWEIAFFIAKSHGYYGTSLHGAITAMSYAVPHYCISKKVEKFTEFTKTWSLLNYHKAINPLEILHYVNQNYDREKMDQKIEYAQNKILENYNLIHKLFRETLYNIELDNR